MRLVDSMIDVSEISRVFIIQAMSQCSLYQKQGIANNFIMDNCLFTGLNQGGYGSVFYTQNPINVTMTNNRFINISWADTQTSLGNEHFPFNCNSYTKFIFENNTVENQDEKRISFIYFQMNLNKDGIQDAFINNNKFINV
jgi:hypothetical protein